MLPPILSDADAADLEAAALEVAAINAADLTVCTLLCPRLGLAAVAQVADGEVRQWTLSLHRPEDLEPAAAAAVGTAQLSLAALPDATRFRIRIARPRSLP